MIKQKTVYNFFKFLEDKRGEKMPLNVKLLYYPETITEKDLHVKGGLDLQGVNIKSLPNNLVIDGDLDITHSKIERLPDDIKVGGSIYAENSNLQYLPDNLHVKGELSLEDCKNFETLPSNLVVDHTLDIEGTRVKKIPDDTKIGKALYCSFTGIKELPDNLDLYFVKIDNTLLEEIPYNFNVKITLYVSNTPLADKYSDEEIKNIAKDRGGFIKIVDLDYGSGYGPDGFF